MNEKIEKLVDGLMLSNDNQNDEQKQKIFFTKYIKNCLMYYIGEQYKDEIVKMIADRIENGNNNNDGSLQQKIDEFVDSKIDELDDMEIITAAAAGAALIENTRNENE